MHLNALKEDGYDVHCLGSSPTSVPPTYDVLVVRSASCSHGATDTAIKWSRRTGKPLVHENGLTGIRRALLAMNPLKVAAEDLINPPHMESDMIDFPIPSHRPEPLNPKWEKNCNLATLTSTYLAAKKWLSTLPGHTREALSTAVKAVDNNHELSVWDYVVGKAPDVLSLIDHMYSSPRLFVMVVSILFAEMGHTPRKSTFAKMFSQHANSTLHAHLYLATAWFLGVEEPIDGRTRKVAPPPLTAPTIGGLEVANPQVDVCLLTESVQTTDFTSLKTELDSHTDSILELIGYAERAREDVQRLENMVKRLEGVIEFQNSALLALKDSVSAVPSSAPVDLSEVKTTVLDHSLSIMGLSDSIEEVRKSVSALSVSPAPAPSPDDLPSIIGKLKSMGFKGTLSINLD